MACICKDLPWDGSTESHNPACPEAQMWEPVLPSKKSRLGLVAEGGTMMTGYELDSAARAVAEQLPSWTWTFALIADEEHMASPVGPGVVVILMGPDDIRVWEKHPNSALEAVKAAIPRARERAAGNAGA